MRAAHAVLDVPAPRAVRASRDIAAQERAARVTSRDRRHAAVYTLVTLYALYNAVTGSDLSGISVKPQHGYLESIYSIA